jgi:hypothetical protein
LEAEKDNGCGFILALFTRGDEQHFSCYGMIVGVFGMMTGTIASIFQLAAMVFSILKWIKVLTIIKILYLSKFTNKNMQINFKQHKGTV